MPPSVQDNETSCNAPQKKKKKKKKKKDTNAVTARLQNMHKLHCVENVLMRNGILYMAAERLENIDKDHCVPNFCQKCVSYVDVNGRIIYCKDCDAKFLSSEIIKKAMSSCPPWPTLLIPIMKRVSSSQRASLIRHYYDYLRQQLGMTEAGNVRVKEVSHPQIDTPMDHANLCNISGCTCQVQIEVNCLIESITELIKNGVTDPPLVFMFKRLLKDWYQAKTRIQRQRWVGNCNYIKRLVVLKKKIKVYQKLHRAKDEEARKQEEAKLEKQRLLLRRELGEVIFECIASLEDSPLICNPKEKLEPNRRP